MRRRAVVPTVTALYLAAVALVTLDPAPPSPAANPVLRWLLRTVSAVPGLGWVDYPVAEFSANVLLFVPMGVLFTLLLGRWRWWLALAIGMVSTLLIEFVQLFLPGRVSDPRDLLANALGTALGIALGIALGRRPGRAAGRS